MKRLSFVLMLMLAANTPLWGDSQDAPTRGAGAYDTDGEGGLIVPAGEKGSEPEDIAKRKKHEKEEAEANLQYES